MSRIERVYYQCDYCGLEMPHPDFKCTDNSGILNKSIDMCSDRCIESHKKWLKNWYNRNPQSDGYTYENHVNDWIIEK